MQMQSMSLQNSFEVEVEAFSLEKTLNCGQTFRFFKVNDYYIYPYKDSIFKIKEVLENSSTKLKVDVFGKTITKEEFIKIFGLDHDIKVINENILAIAPQLDKAVFLSKGIRLMKMDPYEATISFIFSIQSQIPVIQKRLNRLAELSKRSIMINGVNYYLFPKRNDLLNLNPVDIKSLNLGFREKFFLNLIKNYREKDFEKVYLEPYEVKKKFLTSILGVGEKVSECIILFGYGDYTAFPVDTWIIKGLKLFFNIEGSVKKLTDFGRSTFKEFSGYAQQYIYYYMRNFG